MNAVPTEREDATEADLLAHWENLTGRTTEEWRPRHRAPRAWLLRHTSAVVALAAAALTLGGSAVAGARPVWVVGQADVLAAPTSPESIEAPAPEVTDTPLRQRAYERPSRSQRERVTPPKRDADAGGARWVAPLLGRLSVTACFGEDRGDHRHGGLDLDGETGDVVRSVGAGRVVQVGYRFGGAGLTVTVRYGDTLVLYAHLSRTSVTVGTAVAAKQKLGEVGSTGNSTGSHLHLGVARTTSLGQLWDRLVNPAPWLEARGVPVPGC